MAAKLEWHKGDLTIRRRWVLATMLKSSAGWRMLLIGHRGRLPCEKEVYERREDCKAECMREVHRLLKEAGVLKKELDATLADNAELVAAGIKALCLCHGAGTYLPSCSLCDDSGEDHECPGPRACDHSLLPEAFKQPHPGAALLEEHRKALARAEMAEAAHAVTAASLKTALVRARNEGLEMAAEYMDANGMWAPSSERGEHAAAIRALMEPE